MGDEKKQPPVPGPTVPVPVPDRGLPVRGDQIEKLVRPEPWPDPPPPPPPDKKDE